MKDFSVLWNEKYNALVPSASQYLVRYTVFETQVLLLMPEDPGSNPVIGNIY